MFARRVTVITGNFGSGKTEIAVNGALELGRSGEPVTLVDLDVVKPYFRCRALKVEMAGRGVRVVSADGEAARADMPVVPPDALGLILNGGPRVIVDVGGDPVGALVFGAISEALPKSNVEHLLVLNFARPQTETVEQAVATVRAIEAAARLPVSGLVSNTHLLSETTPDTVRSGLRLTEQAAAVLSLPVALVAVEERLVGAFLPGWAPCPVLPLRRLVSPPFETQPRQLQRTGRLAARPSGRVPLREAAVPAAPWAPSTGAFRHPGV